MLEAAGKVFSSNTVVTATNPDVLSVLKVCRHATNFGMGEMVAGEEYDWERIRARVMRARW